MVDNAISSDRLIGMIQSQESNDNQLYTIGCLGKITSFTELSDSRFIITLNGICRYKIVQELDTLTPYRQVKVAYEEEEKQALLEAEDTQKRNELLIAMTEMALSTNKGIESIQ